MFGKIMGAVVSSPLRLLEKVAEACEPIDCLGVQDWAHNASESLSESIEYIIEGDN